MNSPGCYSVRGAWRALRPACFVGGRLPARQRRRGLSLLELVLALGLSALVLYAISLAVDLHLRVLDVRRTQIEEAQVARTVLQMIASDLRGTVPHYRMDLSAVEQMAMQAMASAAGQLGSAASGGSGASGGAAGGAGGGSGSPSSGTAPGSGGANNGAPSGGQPGPGQIPPASSGSGGNNNAGPGIGGSTGPSSGTTASGSAAGSGTNNSGTSASSSTGTVPMGEESLSANTTNLASSIVSPPVVGLYGNQYELQIDVSRLPRPDQYFSLISTDPAALPTIPSDIKSVTYYVQSPDTGVGQVRDPLAGVQASQQPAAGLVRRELDRAALQYAVSNGATDALMRTGDLIAPEVVAVEFQYFDGTTWLTSWDSEQMRGLPIAVEILLMVQSRAATRSGFSLFGLFGTEPAVPEPEVYRLVVYLPMSELSATNEQSLESGLENLGL